MPNILTVVLLAIMLLDAFPSFSQDSGQKEFQLWTDYNLNFSLSKRHSTGGDAGIRGLISNEDWNQFYLRLYYRYSFSQVFKIKAGLADFYSLNRNDENTNELRLYQDLNVRWPDIYILSFFYRLRFEQQFIENAEDGYEFQSRIRGLAGIESRDFKMLAIETPFYISISGERFFPIRDEEGLEFFNSRARITLSMGNRISNKIRIVLGYIWQRSRPSRDESFTNNQNILRVRIYHQI